MSVKFKDPIDLHSIIGAVAVAAILWVGDGVSDLKVSMARMEANNASLEMRVAKLEGTVNAQLYQSTNNRPNGQRTSRPD